MFGLLLPDLCPNRGLIQPLTEALDADQHAWVLPEDSPRALQVRRWRTFFWGRAKRLDRRVVRGRPPRLTNPTMAHKPDHAGWAPATNFLMQNAPPMSA